MEEILGEILVIINVNIQNNIFFIFFKKFIDYFLALL